MGGSRFIRNTVLWNRLIRKNFIFYRAVGCVMFFLTGKTDVYFMFFFLFSGAQSLFFLYRVILIRYMYVNSFFYFDC